MSRSKSPPWKGNPEWRQYAEAWDKGWRDSQRRGRSTALLPGTKRVTPTILPSVEISAVIASALGDEHDRTSTVAKSLRNIKLNNDRKSTSTQKTSTPSVPSAAAAAAPSVESRSSAWIPSIPSILHTPASRPATASTASAAARIVNDHDSSGRGLGQEECRWLADHKSHSSMDDLLERMILPHGAPDFNQVSSAVANPLSNQQQQQLDDARMAMAMQFTAFLGEQFVSHLPGSHAPPPSSFHLALPLLTWITAEASDGTVSVRNRYEEARRANVGHLQQLHQLVHSVQQLQQQSQPQIGNDQKTSNSIWARIVAEEKNQSAEEEFRKPKNLHHYLWYHMNCVEDIKTLKDPCPICLEPFTNGKCSSTPAYCCAGCHQPTCLPCLKKGWQQKRHCMLCRFDPWPAVRDCKNHGHKLDKIEQIERLIHQSDDDLIELDEDQPLDFADYSDDNHLQQMRPAGHQDTRPCPESSARARLKERVRNFRPAQVFKAMAAPFQRLFHS